MLLHRKGITFCLSIAKGGSRQMTTRQAYRDYILAAGKTTTEYLERSIKTWRKHFEPDHALFGYASSGAPAAAAALDSYVFKLTGEVQYAERAKKALLMLRELTSIFPQDIAARYPEYERAVPPMDGLFVPPNYIPAYERIRNSGVLS
jgi:hypothetical protein